MISILAFCLFYFQTVVCSLVVNWLALSIPRLDGKDKSSKERKIPAEVSFFFKKGLKVRSTNGFKWYLCT